METVGTRWAEMYLQRIDDACRQLPDSFETSGWRHDLTALRKRLQDQSKLVAVFGAFSAGKSSLLNALLEDDTLVVSPNPTTAVVTRITQHLNPGSDYVEVHAKTDAELWDDVQQALASLHQPVSDLDAAVAGVGSLRPADFPPAARKMVSFLNAFASGFEEMRPRLGTSWFVDASEIRAYTAEEKYACFLQRVDVPHNSPVLQNGVSLVDTPGVDSIHRRHTDVAFDYMQAADAIVFVLYYTHAFSRADKDFLQQLAGVQDVFGLNKLFVVINAVDLAKSEDERIDVRDRVIQELRQLGIREPRVFEVSSQLGFAASQLACDPVDPRFQQMVRQRLRLAEESPLPGHAALMQLSGLAPFRDQLLAYVQDEGSRLADDTVKRTFRTISLGLGAIARRKQEALYQDEAAHAELRERRQVFSATLQQLRLDVEREATPHQQALRADWEELVYHIGQRIRFRVSTLFREAFHPGRFRDGGAAKLRLREAAEEFVQSLSTQVEVESRTFALRAEQQVKQAVNRWLEQQSAQAAELGVYVEGLSDVDARLEHAGGMSDGGRSSQKSMIFDPAAVRTNLPWQPLERSFQHFSSAKQFFEQGGQSAMLSEVEEIAMSLVMQRVSELSQRICEDAAVDYRDLILIMIEKLESDLGKLVLERQPTDEMDLDRVTAAARWFSDMVLSE